MLFPHQPGCPGGWARLDLVRERESGVVDRGRAVGDADQVRFDQHGRVARRQAGHIRVHVVKDRERHRIRAGVRDKEMLLDNPGTYRPPSSNTRVTSWIWRSPKT